MGLSLTEKIVRLHAELDQAEIPHAFGGALALAFCTHDPRATHDIDVNVFAGVAEIADVLGALPVGIVANERDRRSFQRDGQARLWWAGTPVDIFLASHAFHEAARARCRTVSFAGVNDLPVLDCTDLAVFKSIFARPKDAVDIAAMEENGALDSQRLLDDVADLLGADSPNAVFVQDALSLGRRTD